MKQQKILTAPGNPASTEPAVNYDVLVVGAGIHGVCIALEAAKQGLKTALVQTQDIASGPSASPAMLVGGDLNKLEQLGFLDTAQNLEQLSQLQQAYPHLVDSLPVTVVHNAFVRSKKRVRAGLFLYRKLAKRYSAPPHVKDKGDEPKLVEANCCSDVDFQESCVNSIRLLIELLTEACHYGVEFYNRYTLVEAHREKTHWLSCIEKTPPPSLCDKESGRGNNHKNSQVSLQINSTVLVNSSGCEVTNLINKTLKANTRCRSKTVLSGQIFFEYPSMEKRAYIFQKQDKSLIYLHPLTPNIMCLGPLVTENNDKSGAISEAVALCNKSLIRPISEDDILHCRWASRGVLDNPSDKIKTNINDAFLDLNNPGNKAPLLSVIGVNLAQARQFARQSLAILSPFINGGNSEHNDAASSPQQPGCPPSGNNQENNQAESSLAIFMQRAKAQYGHINELLIERWVQLYGFRAEQILRQVAGTEGLGEHFGSQLYAVEINYLVHYEWAETAEDVLWRRTFLGLSLTHQEQQRVNEFILELKSADKYFTEQSA